MVGKSISLLSAAVLVLAISMTGDAKPSGITSALESHSVPYHNRHHHHRPNVEPVHSPPSSHLTLFKPQQQEQPHPPTPITKKSTPEPIANEAQFGSSPFKPMIPNNAVSGALVPPIITSPVQTIKSGVNSVVNTTSSVAQGIVNAVTPSDDSEDNGDDDNDDGSTGMIGGIVSQASGAISSLVGGGTSDGGDGTSTGGSTTTSTGGVLGVIESIPEMGISAAGSFWGMITGAEDVVTNFIRNCIQSCFG